MQKRKKFLKRLCNFRVDDAIETWLIACFIGMIPFLGIFMQVTVVPIFDLVLPNKLAEIICQSQHLSDYARLETKIFTSCADMFRIFVLSFALYCIWYVINALLHVLAEAEDEEK